MEDTNVVTPQNAETVPTDPATSGANQDAVQKELAEMKARLEQLEREKKGIYADLKATREELKAARQPLPAVGPNTEHNAVDDPNVFVNDLTTRGERALQERFVNYAKPVLEQVQRLEEERDLEKTIYWLAKQEKRDADEIQTDEKFQKDLVGISQKYGITGKTRLEIAQRAYDLLKKERKEAEMAKQAEESARLKAIGANATEGSSAPAKPSGRVFSRAEIAKMSSAEYEQHRAEILRQYNSGLVK